MTRATGKEQAMNTHPHAGNIGKKLREIEFEPEPVTIPVHEPSPTPAPAPAVPVPA